MPIKIFCDNSKCNNYIYADVNIYALNIELLKNGWKVYTNTKGQSTIFCSEKCLTERKKNDK